MAGYLVPCSAWHFLVKRAVRAVVTYTINMFAKKLSEGVVHTMPTDLRKALLASAKAWATWEDITPLARNEFICWVITATLIETRKRRVERTVEELLEGKRRPCCWGGCQHREHNGRAVTPR